LATIRAMQASPHSDPTGDRVISPFSDAEAPTLRRKTKSKAPLWIAAGSVLLLAALVGGFFLFRYLNDPLRTLEPFPVSKYLDSYKSLAGSKFRGNLRVENDLGWKEGSGRLMVFSLRDEPRPVAVMIPPHLSSIYFTKGQTYEGELEVKEGGLIYANSIRKN
jgi:hypothetical protein